MKVHQELGIQSRQMPRPLSIPELAQELHLKETMAIQKETERKDITALLSRITILTGDELALAVEAIQAYYAKR